MRLRRRKMRRPIQPRAPTLRATTSRRAPTAAEERAARVAPAPAVPAGARRAQQGAAAPQVTVGRAAVPGRVAVRPTRGTSTRGTSMRLAPTAAEERAARTCLPRRRTCRLRATTPGAVARYREVTTPLARP